MDRNAQELALVLFGCALPLSVFGWLMLMVHAGLLKDERDQPAWYRWLAPIMLRGGRPTPSLNGAGMMVFLLGFANLIPFLALIDAVPLQMLLVDLAYLLVQAMLVVPLFRGVLAAWRRGRQ